MLRKKICHITTVHPAFDIRIFLKECKSLVNSGYEVILIARNKKTYENIDGINIYSLPYIKNRFIRILFLPFLALFKAIKQKARIYHFHDPELIFVGLILKFLGKKVIYDVHEDVPEQLLNKPYLSKNLLKFISIFFKIVEDFSSKIFDFIITATPHIRERFLRNNFNTIDINNFPIVKNNKVNINWNRRENHLCYIGGIFKTRGIIEIVKALEYVDTILHLAGNFESKELENYVKSLKGWRNVRYYGWVDRNQVKNILNRVKIGVVLLHPIPNYLYSLPTKLFEYMLAGIPVLASNFRLWLKIVEDNGCGICVDPLKIEEIAEGIEYLLTHQNKAKKMGETGRKLVLKKYNWERESKKLLEIYEKL